MSYSYTQGNAGTVTASELVVSIFDQIEAGFYDVKIPKVMWKEVIPAGSVKTDANPGAMNYGYRGRDKRGVGQFVMGDTRNIARVGQTVTQVLVPMNDAAVGAVVLDSDAERYKYGYQSSLSQDLASVMRTASEKHVERDTMFGNDLVGYEAFIDYSTVTVIPATAWTGTDPTAWVKAVQDAIVTQFNATKNEHLADTVYMPPSKMSMLLTGMVIGSAGLAMTGLEFLKNNNMYTTMTGKPLNIQPLRYLGGAGTAGADRLILLDTKEENMLLPFPKPFQLATPVPIPLGVEVLAVYKFGSFNLRYPKAMYYVDVAAS